MLPHAAKLPGRSEAGVQHLGSMCNAPHSTQSLGFQQNRSHDVGFEFVGEPDELSVAIPHARHHNFATEDFDRLYLRRVRLRPSKEDFFILQDHNAILDGVSPAWYQDVCLDSLR